MPNAVVIGNFDNMAAGHIRFLEEASKFGLLHVLLRTDDTILKLSGKPPKFPLAERKYFLEAIRFVQRVIVSDTAREGLPDSLDFTPDVWVQTASEMAAGQIRCCQNQAVQMRSVDDSLLKQFTVPPPIKNTSGRKKVIVTGCYDWFHSGHIRFFEEVSGLGDLYVAVGNDANVLHLKGPGHPMFNENERRYVVGSMRYVTEAMITSGMGWMDAEPEIERIKPDIYAVNEDGDKPEKREFCVKHGLEYVVLKRTPKEGLPRRQSTDLRGF